MINYADYSYYQNEYKGSLSQTLFNSLIRKASRIVDRNVNRKITKEDLDKYNEIKDVVCELCDKLNSMPKSSNLTSVSIDGVSKTYKSSSEVKQELYDILDGLPEELIRYI